MSKIVGYVVCFVANGAINDNALLFADSNGLLFAKHFCTNLLIFQIFTDKMPSVSNFNFWWDTLLKQVANVLTTLV